MNKKDLVSICIITYNSQKYIIETLESVKNQSYDNLELIISDDNSSDHTLSVCEDWVNKNRNRFQRVVIIPSGINTGVCSNINRACKVVQGKWIKTLAGDDCLVSSAIEDYVKFCILNSCNVCVSDAFFIDEQSHALNNESSTSLWNHYLDDIDKNIDKQSSLVLNHIICPGPPLFFSRIVWNDIEFLDTKYAFADEWVMQYKLINAGYTIYPLRKKLIKYRVSSSSLCHHPFDTRSFDSQFQFACDVIIPNLVKKLKLLKAWDIFIQKKTRCMVSHKTNTKYKYALLLSPLFVINKILKNI